jgi:hypothetical protein
MATFIHKEEREEIVSFPNLAPTGKLLSILSYPIVKYDTNVMHIFRAFSINVWILLIFSYLLIIFLNIIIMYGSNIRIKYNIAIDYLSILLGKGNI